MKELPQITDRLSNYELLRIVCMSMILIGHFILHGLQGATGFYTSETFPYSMSSFCQLFIQSLCIVGVNCFILISGYFKIKLRLRSFLSFYFLCLFYNLVNFCVHSYAINSLDWINLFKCFFISKTGNWFFRSYFWLLLASPFLNAGMDSLTPKKLNICVLSLFVLNCFSGFILKSQNPDGYNALQFFSFIF